jgi:hypothetical protein
MLALLLRVLEFVLERALFYWSVAESGPFD